MNQAATQDSAVAITAAHIVPVQGEPFDGTILLHGGRIAAVGTAVTIPPDTTVIDARGGWVLPGFVDAHTHLGVHEEAEGWAGRDTNELTDPVTAAVRALDAINPADIGFDDALSGVDQVVRGDDLLSSSPRQAYLGELLGYPQPVYAHVPLALKHEGKRLAKRDGAVTLAELGAERAFALISESLGWPATDIAGLLDRFDPTRLPREPWTYQPV